MNNNETNFEVNLLPVISLLAVCISFLLLTAVWIPIGTLDIKQAVGESSENKTQPSRIEITMAAPNLYLVSLEVQGKKVKKMKVKDSSDGQEQVSRAIENLRKANPDVNMAFVTPTKSTKYQALVKVLEMLKKLELKEIGISPTL